MRKLLDQVESSIWRRAWQPTPIFSPGEFHGQRSLAGYSSWGHKESDTTEQLTHTHSSMKYKAKKKKKLSFLDDAFLPQALVH